MKTILLAEDDSFISDIYSNAIGKEGYNMVVASDGQRALEEIKNRHPDLLLLDINLPKINGCELLRLIREDIALKDIKVVVISNLAKEEYPEDISRLGVLRYFLKVQSTPEEIASAVKDILK